MVNSTKYIKQKQPVFTLNAGYLKNKNHKTAMLFYLFIQKRRQRQRKEEEKDEDKEEEEDDILWGRHVCKLRYMSWHGIEWKENVDQVKMQVAVL